MKFLILIMLISILLFININNNLLYSQNGTSLHGTSPHSLSNQNVSKSLNTSNSFQSKGDIATLFYIIINNTLESNNLGNVTSSNLTDSLYKASKSIGSGTWSINVDKGKLTHFSANLSSINEDGTLDHTHQFGNFTTTDNVYLTPDNSTTIKGKMDIGLNGERVWKDVNSVINISKGKAITILFDDLSTDNHFKNQPIYGNVKAFSQ